MNKPSQNEFDESKPQRVFATTQWSLIVEAARNDSMQSTRDALSTMCERYWYPLYAYVRRRGFKPDECSDLTQAFFAQFLEKNSIEHADPKRGRFRTFLLSSLKNFITNQWRHDQTQKRGGHLKKFSLEINQGEERYQLEPADTTTPETLFDRRWALTLLATTFEKLENEYTTPEKKRLFERIRPYVVGGADKVPYREVSEELGMTENAIKVAVHRMRKRCGTILRAEIAGTVASEEEIDEELREMFKSLGRS